MELMLLTTVFHGDPDVNYSLFDADGIKAIDDQFCKHGEIRDEIDPVVLDGKPASFSNVTDLFAAVQKHGIKIIREDNVWPYEGD